MALFKSQILTQASGSVGGLTFTRAKGGMVMRARAMPTDPSTPMQVMVRTCLANAVARWNNVLTAYQRNTWNVYAANVATVNRLGDSVFLSGQNMYIRSYVVGEQLTTKFGIPGWPPPGSAPLTYDLGSFTNPTVTISAATGLSLEFNEDDAWVDENWSYMILYLGLPRNPTRNYFKGPFRMAQLCPGDDAVAPTSPITLNRSATEANTWPLIVGRVMQASVAVLRADGRYSSRRNLGPVTVGA